MALIPSKNPAALAAYYLAIFALIPVLGLLLGPAAIIFGFVGLRAEREKPEIEGKGHALTGVILGAVALLVCSIGPLVFGLLRAAS